MPSIPEEIIVRSFQNTANTEELKILNSWLKEDRKNIAYYSQLEEIWRSGKKLPEEVIHKGWKRLSTAIESQPLQESIPLSPQRTMTFMWLHYVAAAFTGILIASTIWMNLPSRPGTKSQDIFVRNVIYNRTGVQSVLLPDHSEVWINEDSRLTYPERFTQGKREVALEGKAYFDIRKKPEQPFIVHVGDVNIEVTGTEFFIESGTEEETFVTLISGSVNLNYKSRAGKDLSTPLIPGQQAVVNRQNGEIVITETDTSYYIAWKDGIYRFYDKPLEEIAGLLGRRFDLDIQISAPLKTKRFTGRVTPDEDIRDVLISLSKSYSIKYQITGKTVKISER